MLNKLLKYDLKKIYKILVIFYTLSLVFSLFTRILFSFENSTILNIFGHISSGITISMIVSILINNIMNLWAKFVNNLYKDESYLTHTLPVTKKQIYLSKFLSSIITLLTSIVVILLSIFIAYYSKENIEVLKSILELVATTYNTEVITLILVIAVVFLLEILFIILSGYTGIIIGHTKNNNKIGNSIIYSLIFYMGFQIITLLLTFIFGTLNQNIMNLFITNQMPSIQIIKLIMYLAIAIYIVYIIIYYIIDIKLLNKGVNIE